MGNRSKLESVIEKIRKLIRHEQSARQIGNEAEAAAFASKIQSLLIEHKLSAEQVSVEEKEEAQRVGETEFVAGRRLRYRTSVPPHDSILMNIIARAHFCAAIVITRSNMIMIIGSEVDRAITAEMFRFLSSTMKRLAREKEAETKRARRSIRRFKPFFYQGFNIAIRERYEERRNQADAETSTALVLYRADEAVVSYVAANHETKTINRRATRGRRNNRALEAGYLAGQQVDLKTGVLSA